MTKEKTFINKDYWAVILGGSAGLGLASAKKLASEGMNICILHRDKRSVLDKVDTEFEEIRNLGVRLEHFNLDVLNPEKRSTVLSELNKEMGDCGKIRALIFSIAKGNLKPMVSVEGISLTHDDFQLTLGAMALCLYDWVKDIFGAKLFAEDARIISFTSEGNRKAWKNYAAVSVAKAALEAISRNIALEFAPFGIRSNCIQAGMTDTESFRMIPGSEALKVYTLQRNPYKRMTTPEDIANVVYLLCTDEAAWINGTVIPVDGGEQNQ